MKLSDAEVRELRRKHAGDVCVCGHERREHYTRGGSTGGCGLKECRRCSNYSRGVEVVHACPPDGNGGIMPCCSRTPFEVPRTDRMTSAPDSVTCKARSVR